MSAVAAIQSRSARPKTELLILQATPFCNLDCDYCYLPERTRRARMSLECIREVFQQLVALDLLAANLTVIWHAGEPTVLPVSYYTDAFAVIEAVVPHGVTVHHAFQSNGTLLDEPWCHLLQSSGAYLGLSIDGPALLHDMHRRDRRGRGSHAAAMRAVDLLLAHGLSFHVITVLTADALEFPDELFDFYVQHGIRQVAFNIEEAEGVHLHSTLQAVDTEARFRRFLDRFLHLLQFSGWLLSVREFDSLIHELIRPPGYRTRNQQVLPFTILTVDCDGGLGTFSPELIGVKSAEYNDFRFGNLWREGLAGMDGHPSFLRALADIDHGVELCRKSCSYFDLCGGGAPSNKLAECGSFTSAETLYCRLTKQTVIDAALTAFEREPPPEHVRCRLFNHALQLKRS